MQYREWDGLPEYWKSKIIQHNREAHQEVVETMRDIKWTCPCCGGIYNLDNYGSRTCYECGLELEEL